MSAVIAGIVLVAGLIAFIIVAARKQRRIMTEMLDRALYEEAEVGALPPIITVMEEALADPEPPKPLSIDVWVHLRLREIHQEERQLKARLAELAVEEDRLQQHFWGRGDEVDDYADYRIFGYVPKPAVRA